MRHALRSLRKSPALAAIAIASLALGIGANLTVYSVIRELVLDNISAAQLRRLVRVETALSYTSYREFRQAAPFGELAFDSGINDTNWQSGDHAEMAWQMFTSANFFDVLAVHAEIGRLYSQADEGQMVAVVSHTFWSRRLHSDPHVLGRVLQVNGRASTIVGVLPRDYRSTMGHGVSPELYAPTPLDLQPRCRPFGRLRDGLTRTQAQAAWAAAAGRIAAPPSARTSALRPLGGIQANSASAGDSGLVYLFLMMLFGLAGTLTLIACSNVAGLLLVRSAGMQHQIAVRKALGARSRHIAAPIAAEAFVLVAGGCMAAIALDAFLRRRLADLRWPNAYNLPVEFHLQADRGLWLYAIAIAFAAWLVCSLQPVIFSSSIDLGAALKRAVPSCQVRRIGPFSFAGLQIVLSVFLLSLGALFARSFLHLARSNPGFDAAHTLIAAVHPFPRRNERDFAWRDKLVRRATSLPGVIGITSTEMLPLMGEMDIAAVRAADEPAPQIDGVYSMACGEQYFTTLGIPILQGRDFTLADAGRKLRPAIVNRTLARLVFAGRNPIGTRLLMGRENPEPLEIVGVVADARIRTLGESIAPAIYTPDYNGEFLVRVAGDARLWIEPLRRALREADATAAQDVRPLSDAVEGAMFPMRMASGFVGTLSCLGLGLALVGLYGSVSYASGLRTREMGLRAALGATRSRLLATAMRDGMLVIVSGIAIGLVLAVAAIRPLVDLVPDGLDPWDPFLFAAVALLVTLTGLAATLAPVRKAATVDPSIALRHE